MKSDCHQLAIPRRWKRAEHHSTRTSEHDTPIAEPPLIPDTFIYHASLFAREFISTLCLFLLRSRLNGSLFIAGPIVTFYINIVFRRPLNNPFVLTFACLSAGDWKKANVAGYPGFKRGITEWYEIALYWLWLLIAQLSGAVAAAYIKDSYAESVGSEFIQGSAWGVNQVYLKVKKDSASSCWKNSTLPIPIQLFGNDTPDQLLESCKIQIQRTWWFLEDLCAVLFLIVSYMHIWKWLRWDDEEEGNPTCKQSRYWEKIVSFSAVTSVLSLTTAMTFPSAHAGWHTSLYIYVYQTLRSDIQITVISMYEPQIRAIGGFVGCLMAIAYEQMLARYFAGKREAIDVLAFKILYQNSNL